MSEEWFPSRGGACSRQECFGHLQLGIRQPRLILRSLRNYRITEQDQDELLAAVDHFRKLQLPLPAIKAESFPLPKLNHVLADIRRELIDGRGIVMVRDFPMDRLDREGVALAYMGFGAYLGEKMVQNKHGHVLGHVKDLGESYGTTGRSYNTSAQVRFHSDACDYVELLCLHPARKGGNSRVASSVTLYNKMLERRPDLVDATAGFLGSIQARPRHAMSKSGGLIHLTRRTTFDVGQILLPLLKPASSRIRTKTDHIHSRKHIDATASPPRPIPSHRSTKPRNVSQTSKILDVELEPRFSLPG